MKRSVLVNISLLGFGFIDVVPLIVHELVSFYAYRLAAMKKTWEMNSDQRPFQTSLTSYTAI